MARKQITGVRLAAGAARTGWQLADVARVLLLEDGKTFPQEQALDQVTRAVNAGDDWYVRAPDGSEARVKAVLRHGRYHLSAPAGEAELMLALPVLGGA